MTHTKRNTKGLKPVSELEVMDRINKKLGGTGFSMILFMRNPTLKSTSCTLINHVVQVAFFGAVLKSFYCLDTLADQMGVLAADEFLCWPEEAAKLAA